MAGGSEQVKASAMELSRVAGQLQSAVARFRVSNVNPDTSQHAKGAHSFTVNPEVLRKAVVAHSAWKSRLQAAIASGKLDIPVSTVKADNQCPFGKWLWGSELSALDKQTEQYRTLKKLHAEFHEEASRVAQFAISGQKQTAEKAMGLSSDFGRASSALLNALAQCGATHSSGSLVAR
ncbi:MAG: CZB domain-containing protein [Bryobacteraceae bacterium]